MSKNIHVHDKTLLYFLTDVHYVHEESAHPQHRRGGVLLT